MANDAQPEPAASFDPIGELLGQGTSANDQHVVRVVATLAERIEPGAQDGAERQADRGLHDEQKGQEDPADVVLVQQEER